MCFGETYKREVGNMNFFFRDSKTDRDRCVVKAVNKEKGKQCRGKMD